MRWRRMCWVPVDSGWRLRPELIEAAHGPMPEEDIYWYLLTRLCRYGIARPRVTNGTYRDIVDFAIRLASTDDSAPAWSNVVTGGCADGANG